MYKSLILSVLDYASITTGACNEKIRDDYEIIQNNALRIIFKKRLLDKVPVRELREKAGLTTIQIRHENLMLEYYERAIVSDNPLIKSLFKNYASFKTRNYIRESLARNNQGSVVAETLKLIKNHNKLCQKDEECYPTALCQAPIIIKQMILDLYSVENFFEDGNI